jgi:hypothetical protein
VVLVPLSPKDMHASNVARRKRGECEKRKLGEAQINGERENPTTSHYRKVIEYKKVTQQKEFLLVSKSCNTPCL